jgi:hypothetical protein
MEDKLAESHQIFVPFRGLVDWDTILMAGPRADTNDGRSQPADPETSWRVTDVDASSLDRGIFAGGAVSPS